MNKFRLTDLQLRVLEKEHIDCADVTALLGDLTDNDVPPTLKGRLNQHVSDCSECQETADSYKWVVELAGELKEREVPSDVKRRLRERLNKTLGLSLPING